MAKETLSQRKIKFRAWHKKLKKMFYLFGIDWQEGICWDKEAIFLVLIGKREFVGTKRQK